MHGLLLVVAVVAAAAAVVAAACIQSWGRTAVVGGTEVRVVVFVRLECTIRLGRFVRSGYRPFAYRQAG